MCKYLKMMLFNSETKKTKYILDPPSKTHRDTNGRDMATLYTHKYLSIPAACDLDFTRSI